MPGTTLAIAVAKINFRQQPLISRSSHSSRDSRFMSSNYTQWHSWAITGIPRGSPPSPHLGVGAWLSLKR